LTAVAAAWSVLIVRWRACDASHKGFQEDWQCRDHGWKQAAHEISRGSDVSFQFEVLALDVAFAHGVSFGVVFK